MKEAEKIIKLAPEKMREMLESVYRYNSNFIKNKEEEKLMERILFAMTIIDRRFFASSYEDTSLPIGSNQTISQPSTIARMIILSRLEPYDSILEIGTGSGYNAAILAFLAYPGFIVSVDRIKALNEKAQQNISSLKNHLKQTSPQTIEKMKINLLLENILHPDKIKEKKYDKIIFTAGIEKSKEEYIEKTAKNLLKNKGRLICPYSQGSILIIEKRNKELIKSYTQEHYVFVPLLEGLEQ